MPNQDIAYRICAPTVKDSKGAKCSPTIAQCAFSPIEHFDGLSRRFREGVPMWLNSYWAPRMDYAASDGYPLVSDRAYQKLLSLTPFEHEVLPVKQYTHESWRSDQLDAPWRKPPSRAGRKPVVGAWHVINLILMDVVDWSTTEYWRTPLGRSPSPIGLARGSFELLKPENGLPCMFNVDGCPGMYVNHQTRRALDAEGIIFGYEAPIRVRNRPLKSKR